ncbi:Disease resistance protein [Corchorus olitorius]|uniref:Probable purine permease n=1 Tax=Corchorus olitorius TaxID=93759 RepID=A0A1R3JCQ3_9ROSI|nr:Disease resistance protein [Corchorus olitorius]
MSVVGEAALAAFFDGLFHNLLSSELLNFVTEKQVRKELKKWEKMLPDIRAVLADAERKQMKDQFVKNWLADLQDLAYDVDDILDEFATQALGRKLTSSEAQSQAIKSKVKKIIPSFLSPKSFMFNKKMMSKIEEISGRMSDLSTKRTQLELREISEGATKSSTIKQRLQPTSLVNETHVYGREKEKAAIVELLLSNDGSENSKVCVIPIVGMGGIGKTTLAQLVYNDPAIKSCFDHRAWICVSEDFDAIAITKTILQSVASDCCDNINDLNLLQVKLKEKMAGKIFLLVLDDVWNENDEELSILLSPFGVGTKILVTTRSQIQRPVPDDASTVSDQPSLLMPDKRWKWWILVVLNIVFLLLGQAIAVILGKFYFDHGGQSKWMGALVQTAGFPVLFIPLLLFPAPKRVSSSCNDPSQPSLFTLTLLYFSLGCLLAIDNYLYSLGLWYLSVTAYSLICASQLIFNVIFSVTINSEKLTFLILKSICTVGVVGLIYLVSSLFSNVVSMLCVPFVPVVGVLFYKEKLDAIKIVAMLLTIWGFASYLYQQYLDDNKAKEEETDSDSGIEDSRLDGITDKLVDQK